MKRLCADDSAATSVKVGYRQASYKEKPRSVILAGFFAFSAGYGIQLRTPALSTVSRDCIYGEIGRSKKNSATKDDSRIIALRSIMNDQCHGTPSVERSRIMINMDPKCLLFLHIIAILFLLTPLVIRHTSFGKDAQSLGNFLGIAFSVVGGVFSVLASYVLGLMSQINGLSLQLDVLRAKIATLEQLDIEANRRANRDRSKTL